MREVGDANRGNANSAPPGGNFAAEKQVDMHYPMRYHGVPLLTGFFIIPTLFSTAESSQGSATKPLSAATRQMLDVRFAHRDQQEGSFHLASLAPLFLCSDPYRSLCCLRIARACRGAERTSRGQKK